MIILTYEINGVKFRRGYSKGMAAFAAAKAKVLQAAGITVTVGVLP